jgi:hypothetical protein
MLKLKLAKPMLVALAACAVSVAFNGVVFADDAQTQALKDQMRIMQQQMQQLQNQIDALSKKQAAPPAAAAEGPSVAKKEAPAEPLFDKFVKGFYGTLDVSIDDSTKGMNGFVAYGYGYVDPTNPNSGFVRNASPKNGGAGPVGRVGWEADLSTNKSVIGWRGAHAINKSGVDFIYHPGRAPAIRRSRTPPRPASATAIVSSASRAIAGASSRPVPRTRRTRNPRTA